MPYIIYYIDCKTIGKVIHKITYHSKENAINNLEKHALEFIRELEGSKQASVAFQNEKTPDQITSDVSLKEGLYLKKENEFIIVYEKNNITINGWWNSYEKKTEKIGVFGIMSFDVEEEVSTVYQRPVTAYVKMNDNSLHGHLVKLFNNDPRFGLKKFDERVLNIKPLTEIKPLIPLSIRSPKKWNSK